MVQESIKHFPIPMRKSPKVITGGDFLVCWRVDMNKRAYYRFNVNLEVRYRILESLKEYKGASSENVSERGVMISLPEYLEPNTRVELIIKIPEEAKSIITIGRIVWIKKAMIGDFYNAGLHFVHLPNACREKLYKYALL